MNEILNLVKSHYELFGKRPCGRNTWVRLLAGLTTPEVATALDRHAKASQFPALPADVLRLAKAPVLSADEAWAIALPAFDEHRTVVWTDEMSRAFAVVRPLLEAGDKVGARMAFRDAYRRMVGERDGPWRWRASLGHDEAMRAAAIAEAVQLGRLNGAPGDGEHCLPASTPQRLLSSDANANANATARDLTDIMATMLSDATRQRLADIRRELAVTAKDAPERERITEVIASLPDDPKSREERLTSQDKATQRRIRHTLGQLAKGRQGRMLEERLLAEANAQYQGVRIFPRPVATGCSAEAA